MSEQLDFIPDTPTDNPFEHLMYKKLHEDLKRALNNKKNSLAVAIDGDWGCGKTTFIKHWKKNWENEENKKTPVIYFDAFKHDYLSDVFSALTEEIFAFVFENKNLFCENKIKNFIDIAKKTRLYILKNLISKSLSAVTCNIIDAETVTTTINHLTENWKEDLGNNFNQERKIFENFAKSLSSLIEKNQTDKPLIFIIDELDRCRPDFALEVLEKVKHVFQVKGVNFIFVINYSSLATSVKHIYGENRRYLDKFFDWKINFPPQINNTISGQNLFSNDVVFSYIKEFLQSENIKVTRQTNQPLQIFTDNGFTKINYENTSIYELFIKLVKTKLEKTKFTIRDFQKIYNRFLFAAKELPVIFFTTDVSVYKGSDIERKMIFLLNLYFANLEKVNLYKSIKSLSLNQRVNINAIENELFNFFPPVSPTFYFNNMAISKACDFIDNLD